MESISFRKKPLVETGVPCREEEGPLSGTMEHGPCLVRTGTDRPCLRPAAVEIEGIPFCERCARKQEAYFAIGELTQELATDRTRRARGFRDGLLAETLEDVKSASGNAGCGIGGRRRAAARC